jgi:hypothetical protein
MDIPTLKIDGNDLQNLLSFISKHERILKEFGAIKIQPNIDCKLALKKRGKNLVLRPTVKEIVKMNKDENIYIVQNVDHIDQPIKQNSLIIDEFSFWSELSSSNNDRRQVNISLLPDTSFFSKKKSRLYFDIHRMPTQSLLKLGGRKVTRQFLPCVKRAHGPGTIFPLASSRQRLFSIDYHHEGGHHHWYIIPTHQQEMLRTIINQQNSSLCLNHGQLFIDPSVLDKYHIRYHQLIQHPNEFVVLSAGTLAQTFTEDASWSESIDFALPSWIEEGHANVSTPPCQCNIPHHSLLETIDLSLFRHELIQRYKTSHLNIITDDKPSPLKGSLLSL